MGDRHLEAAARAAHCAYFDDEGPSPVELACMERAFATGLRSWLDSLLGELPEEAVEAAQLADMAYRKRSLLNVTAPLSVPIAAFIRSLRDSLASGQGQEKDDV